MRSIAILAFALLVTIALAAPRFAPAPTQIGGLKPIPPKAEYFRFKARYVVKDTDEVVQFDLVRPCVPVYGRDIFGDTVWMPPKDPAGYFRSVAIFPKVTADRHAIVVLIPYRCNGETTANGRVPKDLLPFTYWYDDADTLTFAWLYASEDAYESPLAKIRFEGATIETATKTDFLEWQKHAGDGFRPSKRVEHPFGFTYEFLTRSEDFANTCNGIRRLRLPEELRSMLREAWPSDHPRFWMIEAAKSEGKEEAAERVHTTFWSTEIYKYRFDGGESVGALRWGNDTGLGPRTVPTRANGDINRSGFRAPPLFPVVSAPYMTAFHTPERAAPTTLYVDVDTRIEMQGFLACYRQFAGAVAQNLARVPDMDRKEIRWRIDGLPVAGQPRLNPRAPELPRRMFQGDQYLIEGFFF